MSRWIFFLCIMLASSYISCAQETSGLRPQKCTKLLIRKEWRKLENTEKASWIRAVKCLASVRHERLSLTQTQTVLKGKRSLYDDFSYSHAAVAHSSHDNAYFLPWHRWFTHLFDRSLRQTCGYAGPTPYWDWSRDHADLFSAPVFEGSPEYGLGGTGDCRSEAGTDCIVTTGAFATSTSNFELAWPIPHRLRRNLTLTPGFFPHEKPENRTLAPEFIRNATEKNVGDFFRFQWELTRSHNAVHNFVGGDMAGVCPNSMPKEDCQGMAEAFTPNDPLFWLHHAQLDRLWNKWQHHHPSNFAAFSGIPLNAKNPEDPRFDPEAHIDHQMPFDVHSVSVTPGMLFNITSWPLCYTFDESV